MIEILLIITTCSVKYFLANVILSGQIYYPEIQVKIKKSPMNIHQS